MDSKRVYYHIIIWYMGTNFLGYTSFKYLNKNNSKTSIFIRVIYILFCSYDLITNISYRTFLMYF